MEDPKIIPGLYFPHLQPNIIQLTTLYFNTYSKYIPNQIIGVLQIIDPRKNHQYDHFYIHSYFLY